MDAFFFSGNQIKFRNCLNNNKPICEAFQKSAWHTDNTSELLPSQLTL